MKLPKTNLFRTAALRLALQYVFIYAIALGAIFLLLDFLGRQSIDKVVKEQLEQELLMLKQKFEQGGIEQLTDFINQNYQVEDENIWIVLLTDQQSTKVAGNIDIWPSKESPPVNERVQGVWLVGDMFSRDIFDENPFLPVIGTKLPDNYSLVLALATPQPAKLQMFADYLLESLVIALLISLAMGLMLGRTLLKKVDAIRDTARMIINGDLSQRIPLGKREDEFTELARQLNTMLDRIEQLIRGMREVTDNVAHDLRSPLTRLKSRFELILLETRSNDEYRQAIIQGNEELGELLSTFESLLEIAQAESGSLSAKAETFDVLEVVTKIIDLYSPVMEEKGLCLKFEVHPATKGSFEIQGNRSLFAQAFNNILENANKYTPSSGVIKVTLRENSDTIELITSDSGLGIPQSEHDHVFERFVRLDNVHSASGTGLGLSLVRAVCKLHNATLSLSDASPGLIVSMRFPKNQF